MPSTLSCKGFPQTSFPSASACRYSLVASARPLDLLCPLAYCSEAHFPPQLLNIGPVRVSTCAYSELDEGACLARRGVSFFSWGTLSGRAVRMRVGIQDPHFSFPMLCAHICTQRCLSPLVHNLPLLVETHGHPFTWDSVVPLEVHP